MALAGNQVIHDFSPFFKVYEDGRIEKKKDFLPPGHVPTGSDPTKPVPPGLDPKTGVQTRDVVVSTQTGVSARIFLPKTTVPGQKLPLLVHYHGGGFCIGSPFDAIIHSFLTSLVTLTNAVAISVDYRLAPEHRLPIAYDDSWAALQWIATHSTGQGPEPWLNEHADLKRVFLVGESSGANIAHYVAVRAGATGLVGLNINGLIIAHPFFGTAEVDGLYKFICPTSSGRDDDPKLNPAVDPDLAKLGCEKVLVCVAEKDRLRERGVAYYETLRSSGWGGTVKLVESKGEEHCFHIFNSSKAVPLLNEMADFIMAP
ncbi:hypothetical protein L6164_032002 [Bauhinia variegata]|uniref:Uncharacterized protein n=1 Tax=Bauhinia variegata TaxID=167791 RepID=A0ACB9KMK2_BAUVA|nr:hypothetical protein L6164_032002 [Bauhinia variegata]